MVDSSTSRAARVEYASSIKDCFENILRDILKRGYEEQGEGLNPGGIFQRERVPVQTRYQTHGQVITTEAPKRMQ